MPGSGLEFPGLIQALSRDQKSVEKSRESGTAPCPRRTTVMSADVYAAFGYWRVCAGQPTGRICLRLPRRI
jgi:hypothetical protein